MDSDNNVGSEVPVRVDEEQARMIWKQTVAMADYDISQVSSIDLVIIFGLS